FAIDDLRSAEILLREGIYNMVCFHSQQTVEKSLKAFLRQHLDKIPYIHILEELCDRCIKIDPAFSQLRADCKALDVFYQPTRYPEAPTGSLPEGMPNKKQAEETLQKAKGIFDFVQQRILAASQPPDTSQPPTAE
ncbi:MAG: HEPN domain-containing protein, partial [Anaerolineae bacterium]|nr:HEPN domain-containing protein [Anaerolineae bacterium]